ncbi:DUF5133 domain-containing protein [Streptomyces sp. M41]|uniref:DUF5133 domain-containing protein n=1 Tax=Streptomyces sp. M41 TaxID=3059412 RepID=UPI00374DF88C
MLMPHPAMLRRLVDEYEALMAHEGGDGPAGASRPDLRAQDLAYTLCVSTGTRDVAKALEAARRMLAAAPDPVAPVNKRRLVTAGADEPPAQRPAVVG